MRSQAVANATAAINWKEQKAFRQVGFTTQRLHEAHSWGSRESEAGTTAARKGGHL